jgi:hypothetical protein
MDRLVRADPERTRPIRNVSHHLRHSGLTGRGDDTMADDTTTRAPRGANVIISEAVSRGYQVIEDQILQGRDAAERFRAGTYNSADAEADIKKLLDRVMNLVKELGTAGFELAGAAMRDTRVATTRSADVAIETRSATPVQVKYSLTPTSAGFIPSVPALYSNDPHSPPLRKVRFEPKDGRLVLVVDIPDKQPPGVYAGAIVDMETNQAGGFISVSIQK